MAGRGRGLNIFKKQLEEQEAKAVLQQTDTDVTDVPDDDSEVQARLAAVEQYNRQRFADAEGGSTTSDPSIGTGTFVAPFRTYLARIYGQDSFAPPSEAPTTTTDDGQSELKLPFSIGRGRGIFASQSVVHESTSESEKVSDKPQGDTGQDTKVSSGAIPKMGRGRGILFTSGHGTGSSDPSREKSVEDKLSSDLKPLSIDEKAQAAPVVELPSLPPPLPEKPPKEIVSRQGVKGTPYPSIANSIMIQCEKDFGMFEYDVRFKPALDAVRARHSCLRQLADTIGTIRNYDGGETLYLPIKLQQNIFTRVVNDPERDINNITVVITYRRKRSLDECLHFYNVLFERVMDKLKFERIGRKYFDPLAPKLVPSQKLAVWPGYVKAIDELEGGLMLTLDVSHRVLNQRTVYDFIDDCVKNLKRGSGNWQDNFKKGVIGCIVTTKYNNKTYRVDDINFEQNPSTTWKDKEGKEQSYAQYYKSQYSISIRDMKQPILVSRKEVRVSGRTDKIEIAFGLIPELCHMTGLTDEMRSNFSIMKDLAQHTKLSPFQRIQGYKSFLERVNNNEAAKRLLDDWGLKLDKDPVKVTARVLDDERIIFGNGKSYDIVNADFNRQITSNTVFEAYDLNNWLLIFDKRDDKTAENFEKFLHKVSGPSGIKTTNACHIALPNDRIETYVNAIKENLSRDKSIQFVVIIFPTLRDDRYAAVKRVLCSEMPCPSQCINAKTLKNEAKNRSIVQKILLQMNCKLGGALWGINVPLKNTMIVGIDTYHGSTDGKTGTAVGGLVASINSSFTRYFSKPNLQGKKEELVSGITSCLVEALQVYKDHNNSTLPERIIIYRDGVGDGMLDQVRQIEIGQFEDACLILGAEYRPKITFVVVQKNINTKFFKMLNKMKEGLPEVVNPPPGSVLDNTVTRRYFYDFYLCSQHVREGTTTPSHYVVLRDDCNFAPDIMQKLTYKLTYMYYNWPGAVRVPAPCQYAHKLVELIGAAVQRQPHAKLNDKLYFL